MLVNMKGFEEEVEGVVLFVCVVVLCVVGC